MSPSLTTARQILTNLSAAFALGLSAPVDSPLMLFLLFALRPSHHASWRFILCISDVSVFLKHIVNRILCSSFRWYSKAFLKTHCHVHVFRLYTYWYLYVITSGIVIYLLDKSLLSFWYFWWIPNLQKLILKMKVLWDEACDSSLWFQDLGDGSKPSSGSCLSALAVVWAGGHVGFRDSISKSLWYFCKPSLSVCLGAGERL